MRAFAPAFLLSLGLGATACDLGLPEDPNDAGPPDGASLDEVLAGESCNDLVAVDFACGGSPVGDWEIVHSCAGTATWDPLNGTCPQLTTSGSGTASGGLTIRADGSYSLNLTERETDLSFEFPLSCFGGATEPCNGANFQGVCEIDGAFCGCDVSLLRGAISEEGAWVGFGGDLMFQSLLESTQLSFCRVGSDILRLVRFAPDGSGELSWAFVLKRIG